MWKLILKNIWSRRKQNGWLLAELVVVTVVTWVIIDPVVVLWHDTSLPMGYDIDRICKVELASKLPMAKDYDRTASDADAQALLIDKMRMHPSVAIACPLGNKYLSSRGYSSGSLQIDTTLFRVSFVDFYPQTDFFRAYGIKPIKGSPSVTELDSLTYGSKTSSLPAAWPKPSFRKGKRWARHSSMLGKDGTPLSSASGVWWRMSVCVPLTGRHPWCSPPRHIVLQEATMYTYCSA